MKYLIIYVKIKILLLKNKYLNKIYNYKNNQRISKSQEKERQKNNTMIKSSPCQNIINGNDNNVVIKNLRGKDLLPIKLKMQRPN